MAMLSEDPVFLSNLLPYFREAPWRRLMRDKLLAAYEDVHHAIEAASDADLLRHFPEAKGVSPA